MTLKHVCLRFNEIVLLNCTILILLLSFNQSNANYSDDHGDATLSGWTVNGSRTWSESGGYALPQDGSNNQGFLISNNSCANDGTFQATINITSSYQPYIGIVFRWTSTSSYYCLMIYQQDSTKQDPNNAIKIISNSTDYNATSLLTISNLNFTGLGHHYPVKVVMSGSNFTIYLNNVQIGTLSNSDHPSGSVGYAYHSQWNRFGSFDASSWTDAAPAVTNCTWDTASTSGIQAGSGTWSTSATNWTQTGGAGTALLVWPGAGANATFAGSDRARAVTVSSTQYVDSITFLNSGYNLTTGTVNLGTKKGIYVESGKIDTISAVIDGTGGMTKTGSGTLVLSGGNLWTGTTTISAGTVQVGTGGSGGWIHGLSNITNNGALIINRSQPWTYWGVISGTGTVQISGAGAFKVINPQTFTGTFTISSGSSFELVDTGGGSNGTIATANVTNDGTLIINKSTSWGYNGVITGTGAVQVSVTGGNLINFHKNHTYTGTTTISSGSILFLGNGGTTGNVTSDITNNGALTFNSTSDITYSNAISGSGTVNKMSSGKLLFTGANTYSGTTTIDEGSFQIGNGGTTGSVTSSITGDRPVYFNRSNAYSYTGTISGTGLSVTNSGAGTVTLGGTNSYTGATTINAGAFSVSSLANGSANSNIGSSSNNASNLVINGGTLIYTGGAQSCDRLFTIGTNGATLDASGSGALTLSNTGSVAISGTGTRTLTLSGSNTGNNTLAAVIANDASSNATSITKSGSGTWILSGSNTATGPLSVSVGTLVVTGSTHASSSVSISNGATLAGSGTVAGSVSVSNGGSIAPGNGSTATLSTGPLTLNSTSALNFDLGTSSDRIAVTGNLALDGTINISAGSGFTDGTYTIATYTGTLTKNTISIGTCPSDYICSISASGGTVTCTVKGIYTWDISANPGITDGDGTWGTHLFWTKNGTTLSGWPGTGGGARFTGNGSTSYSVAINGTPQVDSLIFVNSGYSLSSGTLNFGTKNGILLNSGASATIGSVIAGSSGLNVTTNTTTLATLNLSGLNTYTGITPIKSNIRINVSALANGGSNSSIGSSSSDAANLILDGGTFRYYTGSGTSTDRLFTLTANGGAIYSSASGAMNFTNSGALVFSGSGIRTLELGGTWTGSNLFAPTIGDGAGGATSLLKSGTTSTWILSADNTYTGSTMISQGTLQIGNGGTTGSITGSTITNNAALVFNRSNPYTYAGVISGTGTVTKSGSGQLTLSGNHLYTGTTTVSGGTLILTGSTTSSSAVSVSSGATLSGTGTIGGTLTVANSGILSPGNSIGTLATGTLTLNNSSVLNFDIGTPNDSIKVTGNLTLDGLLNVTAASGFNFGVYTLITFTGSCTDHSLTVNTAPEGYQYMISVGNNKVTLIVSPATQLLPITIRHNVGSSTSDTCLVYTDDWSVIFDESKGGQIRFLSNAPNAGGTNQLSTTQQRNLFGVQYNQASCNTTGIINIQESGPFYVKIATRYALNNVYFTEEYTLYGSGRIFLKVIADNNSGSSQTQNLSFMTFRDHIGTTVRRASNASANQCSYVLNAETTSDQFDIILVLYDLWSDATGFINTQDDYSCIGLTGSSYTFTNGSHKSWEFMIDFSNTALSDTSSFTTICKNDYRSPDSLEFLIGTAGMEKSWEHHLCGHWKLDEPSGDTARDNSENHRHAYTNGTFSTGKWGNGLQLNGSQNASIPSNSAFDGVTRFTVMAWIKTLSFGQNVTVMGKDDGSHGWRLAGDASGRPTLYFNETPAISATTNVADGAWHHIAANFSWEYGKVMIFVDGKLETIATGTFIISTNSAPLTIGNGLNGMIDDARYYDEQISESTLKSIYQLSYRSAMGLYHVRADNNNSIYLLIDGNTNIHSFPVFRIENYWAAVKPAAGCVKLNGVTLVENTDYFAYLDDLRNELTIGLNTTLNTTQNSLYLDDSYTQGSQMIYPTKKLYCGVDVIGSTHYLWAKNFSGTTLGNSTSNTWYLNWRMSTTSSTAQYRKNGDLWFMATSVEKANTTIDTSSAVNLIPVNADPAYYSTLGNVNFTINGYELRSSQHTSTVNYTIAESSSVRLKFRIERQVSNTSNYRLITTWTIYPTGQIFRYDSTYQMSSSPTKFYCDWYMRYQTNSTVYANTIKKRGGVYYSSGYPDFMAAWLSMKDASTYRAEPFDSDTMSSTQNSSRAGFTFYDPTLLPVWNSSSNEIVTYLDIQHSSMTTGYIDSVANGVQYPRLGSDPSLTINQGELIITSAGDLNNDGFNESEGAYIIEADENTVDFVVPVRNDTCRFYPVFRITNYFAATKPSYVMVYNGSDTLSLLEGYQYNAYHNRTRHELVIQLDSILRNSSGIYISADRTLAVKMSDFWAKAGSGKDTIGWRTESEHENLGYFLYRRIKPAFFDSITARLDSFPDTLNPLLLNLFKKKKITASDTSWIRLNPKIIPGAGQGVSFGPRNYTYIDNGVHNNIVYEYQLDAVDYNNQTERFGPVEVMPRQFLPLAFKLKFNYPNPFKTITLIQFDTPFDSPISLKIYTLQGRLVRNLIKNNRIYPAGSHRVVWDGKNDSGRPLGGGPYLYHLSGSGYSKAQIMIKIE